MRTLADNSDTEAERDAGSALPQRSRNQHWTRSLWPSGVEGPDAEPDELQLSASCVQRDTLAVWRQFNLDMTLASLRIRPAASGKSQHHHHHHHHRQQGSAGSFVGHRLCQDELVSDCVVEFANPFKSEMPAADRLTHLVLLLLRIYLTAKAAVLAFARYHYDLHCDQSGPKVRTNSAAVRSETCALEKDVYFAPRSDAPSQEQLAERAASLELMGDPCVALTGLTVVLYGLMSVAHLLSYFYSLLFAIKNDGIKVNLFKFMYDPLGERCRIRGRLATIVRDLIDSLRAHQAIDRSLLQAPSQTVAAAQTMRSSSASNERVDNNNNNESDRTGSGGGIKSHQDPAWQKFIIKMDSEFLRLLLDPKLPDLVMPANLSLGWHKTVIRFHLSVLDSLRLLSMVGSISYWALMVVLDIQARTAQRLEQIACQKWQPNGVVVAGGCRFHLAELGADNDSTRAYMDYDGSRANFLTLALFVEAPLVLSSARTLFSHLESVAAFFLASKSTSLWYGTYAHLQIDKLAWIMQIQEQMELCVRLVSRMCETETAPTDMDEDDHSKGGGGGGSHSALQRSQLIRALTITYANYELFRRQQSEYKSLVNFMLFQLVGLVLFALFISYLVGTNLQGSNKAFLLFVASFMAVVANVYTTFGVFCSARAERLMKSIMRMLAESARTKTIQRSPIIGLWRRQLLTRDEVRKFFSPSLLGVFLSFDKILTFDVYFVALWLVLLRDKL